MSEKVKTFVPGEEVAIALGFVHEGDEEIESVEAVFVREGSDEEILLLGGARREVSEGGAGGGSSRYTTRLGARIGCQAVSGEYRCARLSVRDRFDDDWDFADAERPNLVVRVRRTPRRLEVTTSEFL